MSFGFGGGSGGFGSNSNQQQQQQQQPQGSAFGGFGSNNAASSGTGGFGAASNTGFGSGNTNQAGGGGLFGGGSGTTGFGSGGFGAANSNNNNTQTSAFGAKPFGTGNTSSSGGFFGNNTATSAAGGSGGFGGFGSTTNNPTQSTSSPFGGGGGATGNSMFGSKPAFGNTGNTGNTGTSLFGSGGTGGFGSNNTSGGAFGAPASTALGGVVPPSEGTGSTPFQAFQEKDAGSTQTNHFQTISFMQPYQKYSLEELRIADYNQGRRYGNSNNQPGAFGTGTGFGGFGNTNTGTGFGATSSGGGGGGGLFGAGGAGTTSSAFNANQASSAFGGNTAGSGLFGAKPAGGGLFGSAATTTSQQVGGLFGSAGSNTGGFGSSTTGTGAFGSTSLGAGNNAANNQGGGLFGSNNNNQQQQSNPFGAVNASSGFGTSSGGGLFGGTPATSSAFGGAQQQQPNQNPFASLGQNPNQTQGTQGNTGGLFGSYGQNNQPKPAGGLFGSTGSSMIGSNTQNQNNSNPFNTATSNPGGSSLFGKPLGQNEGGTAASGGLFGGGASNNATGGGLFGSVGSNNQNQQNQGGLFGGNSGGGLFGNNQQAKPTGLFGASNTNQQAGGGLFGSNNQGQQPPAGSSMFGGSSLLGNSQQNQPQPPQPQGLSTSILDVDPFGSIGLLNGLNPSNAQNTGPIATPLSNGPKSKKSPMISQWKINPTASSRMTTPQKRTGYGLSYNSPFASASSTPGGLSSSLLGGSLGRGLGKSLSTSNLRGNFDNGDSVLSPMAFSASGNRRFGANSLKSLNINHNMRTELFPSSPQTAGALPAPEKTDRNNLQGSSLKKKVSFDATTVGGKASNFVNGESSSRAGVSTDKSSSELNDTAATGSQTNGSAPPEMEQVRGNELAIVPEDGSPPTANGSKANNNRSFKSHQDQEVGSYWMKPTRAQIKRMPREKQKKASNFQVGRHGCGYVEFLVPVDLTSVDLDILYDNIVQISTRHCTVYPNSSMKPAVGQGLNVPSQITLQNSWPRARGGREFIYDTSGPKFDRHLDRLQKSAGTHFKEYNKDTGTWVFTVDHFTTYGLDYDDEDEDGTDELEETSSTPASMPLADVVVTDDLSMEDDEYSGPLSEDDTFDFRKARGPPGAFDRRAQYLDDTAAVDEDGPDDDMESFLDDGSVGSSSSNGVDEPMEVHGDAVNVDGSIVVQDETSARSGLQSTTELERQGDWDSAQETHAAQENFAPTFSNVLVRFDESPGGAGTPAKAKLRLDGDWAEQLQRTISPKKQDRSRLREMQGSVLGEAVDREETPKADRGAKRQGQGFNTSIDLMNSLFGQQRSRMNGQVTAAATAKGRGFEWPYTKKPKTLELDESDMDSADKAFHASNRPTWGPNGTFIYAKPGASTPKSSNNRSQALQRDVFVQQHQVLVSQGKDVWFAKLAANEPVGETLALQKDFTRIEVDGDIPLAQIDPNFSFSRFRDAASDGNAQSVHEKVLWGLASVLFDAIDEDFPNGFNVDRGYAQSRRRKDGLSEFWARLVHDAAMQQVQTAESKEAAAFAYLSAHQVPDACGSLLEGRNFRLSTLVAMIGGDKLMRSDMSEQLDQWRQRKVLSEILDPVRALYELLAGNTSVCDGSKGALEDRAQTFVMSKRFGLNWRQSFGLKLWYGILEEQPLEIAISKFIEDLERQIPGQALPLPWFTEEQTALSWEDPHKKDREDLLLGLLKVYADLVEGKRRYSIEDILSPYNHQTSPLDFRLAWQLFQLFRAHEVTNHQPDSKSKGEHATIDDTEARLTTDFAWQLESAGQWLWAVFVSLHLRSKGQRISAVQSLLARYGGSIGDGHHDETFKSLVEEFRVPERWVWEAKALHARSVEQNSATEVAYLLKAHNWEEAHKTLCRTVAPEAIIENDSEGLQQLLTGFDNVNHVRDWRLGGQVYLDYLRLLELDGKRETISRSEQANQEKQKGLPQDESMSAVLKRLITALPAMMGDERKLGLHEKVAVQEMSGVVGRIVLGRGDLEKVIEKAKVLSLPLTEDRYLKHTVDLSFSYYKSLVAGVQ
ncbi:MAG: hypothetical protein M1833_004476 [Piccolia ochrophora]|nr:MAG: hypothetical protein M1833_004476 [Piccolia ochrophora]